jgi:hypothetical protein
MKQNGRCERKKIEKPSASAAATELQIAQAADSDALRALPQRNCISFVILFRISYERVHREACFSKHLSGVKGKRGRGNVLRIEKLAQKQDVPLFMFHRCVPFRTAVPVIAQLIRTEASFSFRQY